MQLTSAAGGAGRALRVRLGSAAALVLAAGAPVAAQAATDPSLRIEASGLFYTEAQRTTVYEPIGRITRLFADGQTLSAQFAVDVMTGASPTGANPAGRALTTTSASGSSTTVGADAVPTARFSDTRAALDLEWARPIGIATPTLGLHVSREKDYQSHGGNASLSVDLDHRLLTVTAGVGRNQDRVFPMAGVVRGLTTGTRSVADAADKQVTSGLLGLTRVLTRRWLMGVNVSHISERGAQGFGLRAPEGCSTAQRPELFLTGANPRCISIWRYSAAWAMGAYCGPRISLPGISPVASPFSKVTTPSTRVAT